jgi:hypothetical protein
MKIEELDIDVRELLDQFIIDEKELLEVDVSEQAISSSLSKKMELFSRGWNVDCEYNRDLSSVKKLKYALSESGNIEERNVIPDIIIHKRKTNHNLLAVEVKKVSNTENRFKDESKLKAFREQLGYKYTLFVDFKTGSNPKISSLVFLKNE